ncbi:UDP-N-acetylglucosamine 2-epimerase (hydrolyzing), partial [bacterium]|nr:UDP-N-acetylglucosamine 2-epimerase (hydrolyzing) [bacterium]
DSASSATQMSELLTALDALADMQLLFTMPNADTESRALIALIEDFVASHANARAYTSLGTQKYLSCIAQVDGVLGNSSSGLLEVPSFHKGTINIGDRQGGRLKAASVIDCEPTTASIAAALHTLYSPAFQASLASVVNPYGTGGASAEIVRILRTLPLDGLIKKTFHDLSVDSDE